MAGIAYLIVFAFIPLVMSQTTPNPNDKIYNFTTWETDGESLKQFQLNGDANTFNNQYSASQRGGRLGLCRSQSYTAGSAYLLDPVNLDNNASFSTSFTLVMDQKGGISDNDGQGADGIVFIINSKTNVLGAVGQGIGYSGIGNSIGIEFDTYNNGAPIDYNGNHIGINIGGNQSSQMYFTVPKRMNDGDDVYGWVDYSGTDLQVRYNINNNTRPNNAILTYVVNLVKVFKSNSVYIGFSSATGGAYGAHYVKTWTFINKYQPLADIPLPITSSAMTTSVLSTAAMTTAAMTTSRLTTASMTTAPMTTAVMTTSRLTTASITTASMTTAAMTTKSMTTQLPFTTQALTTQEGPAITSSPISTSRMTTARMTTAAITTSEMTTSEFTTAAVTTKAMTTSRMTTSAISTAAITTSSVTSAAMTTQAITTYSNLCANVTCGKISECHQEGICNPLTGKCVNNFANGITCDDGSVCTTADVCLNGKCVGTQITPCIPYILLNNQTTQIVPTQSSWLSLMFKGLMNITMFHVRILNYPTFNSAIDDGNYTESVIKYPGNSTETFKDYSAPNNYDGLGPNQTDFVAFKWVPAQTIGAISSIALSVEVNYTLFNGFNGANIHPVLIPVVPSTGYFSIANMDFDVPTGSSLWVSISIKGLSRLTDFRASLTDLNGILSFSYPNNLGYTSLQLNDYINVGETDYFAFRVIVPQTPKSLIIYPQLTIQWSDGTTILKDVRAGLFNIADLLGKRSRDTSDLSFTLDEVKVPAEVGSWVTLNVDAEADVTDVSFVLSSLILKFAYGNNQSNAVVGNIVSTESSFGAVWIDAPEGRYPVTATFTYKKGGVSLTSTQSFTIRSVTQPISVSTSSVSVVAGQSSIQSIGYSSQYSISEFIPQAESLDGWRVERVSDGKVEDASDGWLALFQITAPSTANGTFVLPISVQYNSGNEMDTTSFPVLVSVKASDATTTTNLQPDESDSTGSSKLSPGAVAGIAVGGVAGVALIAAAGVLVRKRRIRKVQPFRFQESIEMKNATATHPQVFMHKA